jgi:hypothetical protein
MGDTMSPVIAIVPFMLPMNSEGERNIGSLALLVWVCGIRLFTAIH